MFNRKRKKHVSGIEEKDQDARGSSNFSPFGLDLQWVFCVCPDSPLPRFFLPCHGKLTLCSVSPCSHIFWSLSGFNQWEFLAENERTGRN